MRNKRKKAKLKRLSAMERRKAKRIKKDNMYGQQGDNWSAYYYNFNRVFRLSDKNI